LRRQKRRVAVARQHFVGARLEPPDDLLGLAGKRAPEAERDVLARRHPDAEPVALRLVEAEPEAAGDGDDVGGSDVLAPGDDLAGQRLFGADRLAEHAIAEVVGLRQALRVGAAGLRADLAVEQAVDAFLKSRLLRLDVRRRRLGDRRLTGQQVLDRDGRNRHRGERAADAVQLQRGADDGRGNEIDAREVQRAGREIERLAHGDHAGIGGVGAGLCPSTGSARSGATPRGSIDAGAG
jgi:hypothetical protein